MGITNEQLIETIGKGRIKSLADFFPNGEKDALNWCRKRNISLANHTPYYMCKHKVYYVVDALINQVREGSYS